jgi:hypothetical protein
MRRKTLLLSAAAALVVALPAGWYFGSPWWTLWRMREAARAGDWTTLASYVDLETMNAGAAAKARAYWQRSVAIVKPKGESARQFIHFMKQRLANAEAEAPVRLGQLRPWLSHTPMPTERVGGFGYHPYIVHHGLTGFDARDRRSSEENGPVLTFRRRGLGWRLVGVRWGRQ